VFAANRGQGISIRVTILASGSSGNCTLLETSRTRLLVDAGLGKRETLRRISVAQGLHEAVAEIQSGAQIGSRAPADAQLPDQTETPSTPSSLPSFDHLDGIVISHEHADHIGGLPALLGKWRTTTTYFTPACHAETLRSMSETHVKRFERVEFVEAGQGFSVGDIEVMPFAIPHDAVDPIGFTFCSGGVKVAVVTDLGYMPELVKHRLRDADVLVLESNHDLEMLKVGPYPWHIKQRVMSRTGHLSNHTVSEFLADPEGFDAHPRYLVLAHLSENNNNPDVARICAEEALGRRPDEHAFRGQLLVASQYEPLLPIQL
jgi:phosphoribosyl 1,2-cyclic phosphodiesterase